MSNHVITSFFQFPVTQQIKQCRIFSQGSLVLKNVHGKCATLVHQNMSFHVFRVRANFSQKNPSSWPPCLPTVKT